MASVFIEITDIILIFMFLGIYFYNCRVRILGSLKCEDQYTTLTSRGSASNLLAFEFEEMTYSSPSLAMC